MPFDPDAYLAQTAPTAQPFDPDKYLEQPAHTQPPRSWFQERGDELKRGLHLAAQMVDSPAIRAMADVQRKQQAIVADPNRDLDPTERWLVEKLKPGGLAARANERTAQAETRMQQAEKAKLSAAESFAENQRAIQAIPQSRAMAEFQAAKGWGGKIGAAVRNPLAVPADLTLNSVPAMVPGMIGGAALGSEFGPGGTAVGAFMGSLAPEYQGKLIEVMVESGVDPTNPQAVIAFMEDPVKLAHAQQLALRKGLPIALIDAISGGVGGRILGKALGKGTAKVALAAGAEGATQAAAGGAGEALGELAAGENLDAGNILSEMLAEGPTAIQEVGTNIRHERAVQRWGEALKPRMRTDGPAETEAERQGRENTAALQQAIAKSDAANTLPAAESRNQAQGVAPGGTTSAAAGDPLAEIDEILAAEKAQADAQRAQAEAAERRAAQQKRSLHDLVGEALAPRVAELESKTDLEKHDFWRGLQYLAQTLAGLQTTNTDGKQARSRQLSLEEMREQAGLIFAGAKPELLDAIALKLHGSKPAESVAALRNLYTFAAAQRQPFAAAAQEREQAAAAKRQAEIAADQEREAQARAEAKRAAQERAKIRDTGRDAEGRVVEWSAVPDAELERLAAEPEDAAQVEITGAQAELERRGREEGQQKPLTREQQLRLIERYGGINPEHPVHGTEIALIRESGIGKNKKLFRDDGTTLDRLAEQIRQDVQNGPQTEAEVLEWLSELAAGRAPKLYERGDIERAEYARSLPPGSRFSVQRPQPHPLAPERTIPGFNQVDFFEGERNTRSATLDELRREDYEVPDIPEAMPTGQYSEDQVAGRARWAAAARRAEPLTVNIPRAILERELHPVPAAPREEWAGKSRDALETHLRSYIGRRVNGITVTNGGIKHLARLLGDENSYRIASRLPELLQHAVRIGDDDAQSPSDRNVRFARYLSVADLDGEMRPIRLTVREQPGQVNLYNLDVLAQQRPSGISLGGTARDGFAGRIGKGVGITVGDLLPDVKPQPDGTYTARFAAAESTQATATEEPLTPQAAKAKEREERKMRRVAPRLFAEVDVRIAEVERTMREAGYAGEIPADAQAVYLPRLRAEKDLLVVGLRAVLRGLGLARMLHEGGHAYWRMLSAETRAALNTAYQRDLREHWSPLWRDGELITEVSQQNILEGDQLGLEEWFSELMASLNADWAERRSLPRVPGWIGDIAAKLRDFVQRLFGAVADHNGLQGDERLRFITEDFRAFLTRGQSFQRTAAAGAQFARSEAQFAQGTLGLDTALGIDLPAEIAGLVPNYQDRKLRFQSRLDKALYYVGAPGNTELRERIVASLQEQTGFTEGQIRSLARSVRDRLPAIVRSQPQEGAVRVPEIAPALAEQIGGVKFAQKQPVDSAHATDTVPTNQQIDAYLDRQAIPAERRAEAAEQLRAVFERGEADFLPGLEPSYTRAAGTHRSGPPAAPAADQRPGRGLAPSELTARIDRAQVLRTPEQADALIAALGETGRVSRLLHDYVTGAAPVWDIRGAVIEGPQDIAALSQAIRSPYFETFKVAFLDDADRVVHSRILTLGTLTASLVGAGGIVRELQFAAQATKARRLIVAHNHPSGNPAPSGADFSVTRELATLCRDAKIELIDHVITNGKKYYSFRTEGLVGGPRNEPVVGQTTLPANLKEPLRQDLGTRQPWEAIPIDELAEIKSPKQMAALVDGLRNTSPDTLHVAHLSTSNNLLALERIAINPEAIDARAVMQTVADGIGREGSSAIIAILPKLERPDGTYRGNPERHLFDALRQITDSMGIRLFDVFGHYWASSRSSYKEMGLMEGTRSAEQAVREPPPVDARERFEAADAKVREIGKRLAALEHSQAPDAEAQGHAIARELEAAKRERKQAYRSAEAARAVEADPVHQALAKDPQVRALREELLRLTAQIDTARAENKPREELLDRRDAINEELQRRRTEKERELFPDPERAEPPVTFGDPNPPRNDDAKPVAAGAPDPRHLRPILIDDFSGITGPQLAERLARLKQLQNALPLDLEVGPQLQFLARLVRETREEMESRRTTLEHDAEQAVVAKRATPAQQAREAEELAAQRETEERERLEAEKSGTVSPRPDDPIPETRPSVLAAEPEETSIKRDQAAQATLDAEAAAAIPDAPEESYPVRDDVEEVGAQVSAATLEPKSGLRKWLEKAYELLRGFRSAVPELPTFKGAERFATFREGLRLLQGLDEVVQHEAQEAVADIVAPLQAHSTTEARSKQARLQELRRQAAASPAAKAARAAEIAKLEQEMQGDAWWIFQNVVLYGDLFTRSRLYRRDDGSPIGLPGGLNPAEAEHLFKTWLQRAHAHPQAKAIMEARERHKAFVQRIAGDLQERGFVFAEGSNTNYFPHVMLENWDGDIAHVKAGTAKDFRGYLVTPTGSAKPIETDYLKAMYYHAVQVMAHNKRADILRDYVAREDIKQRLVDEAKQARRRDPDEPPVNWRQIFHTQYAEDYALFSPDPDEIPLHPEMVIDRDALAHRLGVVLGSGPLQEELKKAGLTGLQLQPSEIHEMLVKGSSELWVLPKEVAEALRGVSRRAKKTDNLVTKILGGTQGLWKRNILFAPWNWLRFEFNNVVSDSEKILVSDPAMAAGLLDAGRDVYAFISGSKEASDDVREAFRLGVLDTLTAAEVQALRAQRPFEAFETAKDRNWRVGVNRATSFFGSSRWNTMGWSKLREATFRFAKYKADLERMRHGATPRYGGAYWKNVEAMQRVGAPEAIHEQDRTGRLIGRQGPGTGPQASAKPYAIEWEQGGRRFEETYATREERAKKRETLEAQQRQADTELVARKAAAISRATFGDYGELTPNGNSLRRLFIPFYAWTEVNFRYHANLLRNMRDMLASGRMDRKAAAGQIAKQAVALGSRAAMGMVLRLALPYLAVTLWNSSMFGDDEDDLSEEDRRRFHLLLGRDDDGKIRVVYLPTAFSDVLKWFSGNRAAALVGDVAAGRTDWQTAAGEFGNGLWRDALNNTLGSAGPVFKIPYTLVSGKSTFPDVTDQRTIPSYDMRRVILGQMTDQFTAEMLELAINKDYVASRDAGEWAQQAILQVRRRDPESWAFYAIKDKAAQFEEAQTGRREQRAAYDAPDAQVLRQFRRAIYQADVPTAVRMYQRLLELGYTAERFESSVRAQDPLYGLPKAMRDEFVHGLNASERDQLRSAYRYYLRMEEMEGAGRRLFPQRNASATTRARYQSSPRLDVLHGEIQRAMATQGNDAEADRRADRALREAVR